MFFQVHVVTTDNVLRGLHARYVRGRLRMRLNTSGHVPLRAVGGIGESIVCLRKSGAGMVLPMVRSSAMTERQTMDKMMNKKMLMGVRMIAAGRLVAMALMKGAYVLRELKERLERHVLPLDNAAQAEYVKILKSAMRAVVTVRLAILPMAVQDVPIVIVSVIL